MALGGDAALRLMVQEVWQVVVDSGMSGRVVGEVWLILEQGWVAV